MIALGNRGNGGRRHAFTLIELLTVIAIIGLLISILIPSLGAARRSAKRVTSRATLKAISDGMEMFKNDNERYYRTSGGYPPSASKDDPTETGNQTIFGAQWAVRYLLGKDLRGFIPNRFAPASMRDPGALDEQVDWYESDAFNDKPLDRLTPYLDVSDSLLTPTMELEDSAGGRPEAGFRGLRQPVFIDAFGFPVLYYAANAQQVARATTSHCTLDANQDGDTDFPGIFTFNDNAMFTGLATGNNSIIRGWDFDGYTPEGERAHKIANFGDSPPNARTIGNDPIDGPHTFQFYVLNKSVYESTGGASGNEEERARATMMPRNKSSFLLISPGADGIYGTSDDVTNFDR